MSALVAAGRIGPRRCRKIGVEAARRRLNRSQRTRGNHEEDIEVHACRGTFAVTSVGSAFAADLPKEGSYDFTACYSGVANPIAFSKTHSAVSYEHSGAILSNPPGGIFDKGSFHCVGLNTSFGRKATNTTVCETVFPDGDKILATFSLAADGTTVREAIGGTGKYEGVVSGGTVIPLGPFPVIKAGTYQTCNHQTGTYKLK